MKVPASLASVLAVLSAAALSSSCISEDRSCCCLSVSFSYTCNVKEADAFISEVKDLELYIFDSKGQFVERFCENAGDGFEKDYRMVLPSLAAGKYSFVALGRNRAVTNSDGEFRFGNLQPGKSVLADLILELNTRERVSNADFAAVYNGITECELQYGRQSVEVPMAKLTNRLRVMMIPYDGTKPLDTENYRFSVQSGATLLDYKGDMLFPVPTVFRPYRYVGSSSPSPAEDEIGNAIIADFHLSRLMVEDAPILSITMTGSGRDIVKVNLAWLLSLQGIPEHRREWSDQEYLDRQDTYSITFFIDGETFVKSRIIINGWVISLDDVSLG